MGHLVVLSVVRADLAARAAGVMVEREVTVTAATVVVLSVTSRRVASEAAKVASAVVVELLLARLVSKNLTSVAYEVCLRHGSVYSTDTLTLLVFVSIRALCSI